MKPFNFNEYLKNNPLLKEEETEQFISVELPSGSSTNKYYINFATGQTELESTDMFAISNEVDRINGLNKANDQERTIVKFYKDLKDRAYRNRGGSAFKVDPPEYTDTEKKYIKDFINKAREDYKKRNADVRAYNDAQYKKTNYLKEDKSNHFKEIWNALDGYDGFLGKQGRLDISKEEFEEFVKVVSEKTQKSEDEVRDVFLDKYVFEKDNPEDGYENGNFLNGYEVLKSGLKDL
jgi:sarcosine oxidase delta subunit